MRVERSPPTALGVGSAPHIRRGCRDATNRSRQHSAIQHHRLEKRGRLDRGGSIFRWRSRQVRDAQDAERSVCGSVEGTYFTAPAVSGAGVRRKNERPTVIYWLVDTRTNTPFYCGKTVQSVEQRLEQHRIAALRYPSRLISHFISGCGEHIRIEIMEIVPADKDWCERERHWIKILRFSFPNNANTSDGGEGAPGVIATAETRAKLSAVHTGIKLTPVAIAKRTAKIKGTKRSAETRARQSVSAKRRSVASLPSFQGCKHNNETRAKMSIAAKKRGISDALRIAAKAASTGRKKTPEELAKIGAAHKGKIVSPETRAKLRAAALRQHASALHA